jgi:hypothetical protein
MATLSPDPDRKTTLELPDELMRRIKLRAVHRNRKLKDEIAQRLEAGLAGAPARAQAAHPGRDRVRHRRRARVAPRRAFSAPRRRSARSW